MITFRYVKIKHYNCNMGKILFSTSNTVKKFSKIYQYNKFKRDAKLLHPFS